VRKLFFVKECSCSKVNIKWRRKGKIKHHYEKYDFLKRD
jgi:hypothetical protein